MHILSKLLAYGILTIFLVVLTLATFFAYSRGYSGTTRLDMAKVQKMRTDAARQTAEQSTR